jgi:hypothetical protein
MMTHYGAEKHAQFATVDITHLKGMDEHLYLSM